MKMLLSILLFLASSGCFAQEIHGIVTDSVTREPIVNATVTVMQGGILKGGCSTDFDGRYSIKPLDAGYYEVSASYIPYKTNTHSNTIVATNEKTTLDFPLQRNPESLREEVVKKYFKPVRGSGYTKSITIKSYRLTSGPALLLPKRIDPLAIYQAYYNDEISKITHGNFKPIENPHCYLHPELYIINR